MHHHHLQEVVEGSTMEDETMEDRRADMEIELEEV